jgi:hypothetical protein
MATTDSATQSQRMRRRIKNSYLIAIGFFAFIPTIGALGFYLYQFSGPLSHNPERWAQFGDYFGGILNPLLSFSALIAILITIRLQSDELQLSTDELAKSATALGQQLNAFRQQNFESTFFQLMRLLNDVTASLTVWDSNATSWRNGRECFRVLRRSMDKKIKDNQAREVDTIKAISKANDEFYSENFWIGHYFRTLYHIFKYVKKTRVEDSYFYARLVRAQLSDEEVILLFYNALGERGLAFKPFIEDFALLNNLNESLLVDKNHMTLYGPGAFDRIRST